MSLDLYLESPECVTCGHSEEYFHSNYTYNVSKMWYEIYPDAEGMVDIDKMTGTEAYKTLCHARTILEENPSKFIKMNPENGWGNYHGFLDFINALIKACLEHPTGVWNSWR